MTKSNVLPEQLRPFHLLGRGFIVIGYPASCGRGHSRRFRSIHGRHVRSEVLMQLSSTHGLKAIRLGAYGRSLAHSSLQPSFGSSVCPSEAWSTPVLQYRRYTRGTASVCSKCTRNTSGTSCSESIAESDSIVRIKTSFASKKE